jgi:hypothetical protein
MFDFRTLAPEDQDTLIALVPSGHKGGPVGSQIRSPDLVIAPDGVPYIYRWHLIPRRAVGANVYLHLQVADDPERPLHDHPWDNQSVILSGGYREVYWKFPPATGTKGERIVKAGDVVSRKAEEAHRIFLLRDALGELLHPYTISLFTTGPVIRDWGFWFDEEHGGTWVSHDQVIEQVGGQSVFKKQGVK